MKLAFVFMLFALAAVTAAAPNAENIKEQVFDIDITQLSEAQDPAQRNVLINLLVKQAIEYLRRVIKNGSWLLGIGSMDPLYFEHYELHLPTGLINLHLYLDRIRASGLGDFVMRKSNLNLRELSFEFDLLLPEFDINAEDYDFTGDLFTAIPLFGKGEARFETRDFAVQGKLLLKQSEDGKSILIDRIANISYQIPHLKSYLTGVIGGGDIDAIVNKMVEEVFLNYILRFNGPVAMIASQYVTRKANPILERLDTWRFIAPLIPRS